METKILVVDDDAEIRNLLSTSLELEGYNVEALDSGEEALRRLQEKPRPSLTILDLAMPGISGMETLRRLRELTVEMPVLVLSCMSSPGPIVEAIQNGASDYIVKPFEDSKLKSSILRLLEVSEPPASGSQDEADRQPFIARNEKMLKIQDTIRQISRTDVPVFIHGESGVGKEVVARAIHESSDRRDKKFLKINCAALPSDLLESELFGYERGAFTGAINSKPGKFQLADQGTIFLDEISEMAPALQAKLLQVLQDGQFSRLGGKTMVQVDVRVLAATNVNPAEALRNGSFRKDLYYRLTVVNVQVPPLRERMDELQALTSFFLEKYGAKYGTRVTPSARMLAAMQQYDWPGNIRELENVIRRYIVLHGTDLVESELENAVRSRLEKTLQLGHSNGERTPPVSLKDRVNGLKKKAEAEAILQALNATNWNRKEAAKLLNISYKSFLYRMKVLDMGRKQG
jgi:two-component system response regulator AtoC